MEEKDNMIKSNNAEIKATQEKRESPSQYLLVSVRNTGDLTNTLYRASFANEIYKSGHIGDALRLQKEDSSKHITHLFEYDKDYNPKEIIDSITKRMINMKKNGYGHLEMDLKFMVEALRQA